MFMLPTMAFIVLIMPGCGGCSCRRDEERFSEKEQEQGSGQETKEQEKPKPDLEVILRPSPLPFDENSSLRPVKPGHWVQSVQELRANNFDIYADLNTELLNHQRQPLGLEGSNYHLRFARPAALAKGNPKRVAATYFIPRLPNRNSQQVWLGIELLSRQSGRRMLASSELTSVMPHYQYVFVVLAKNPLRFQYLKRLNSVLPARGGLGVEFSRPDYRVVAPQVQPGQTPLPDNALAWSAIAYILWDEIDPDLLTVNQQTALVDWLHWGGQIIIDGPNSLAALQASFLAEYLPARKARTVELRQNDFDELNTTWAVAEKQAVRDQARNLDLADKSLLGIELDKHDDAEFLPHTGGLLAERQIGRGRIVVTAFPLSARAVTDWSYQDGFFNACLLRRPGRRFVSSEFSLPNTTWSDHQQQDRSPLLNTAVRFFSRDVGSTRPETIHGDDSSDAWHFGGFDADDVSGVGGWNDFSGAAAAARQSLKDAAGISPPSAKFVLSVLAAYLLVLVPVNWGFFRVIGHVEWAWIAAPVIAVLGTILVVRSAQLDIGFVRSRTEVAVLEFHGGYSRAHLTRFTALYSSLSTTYEFSFEDPAAQALPFSYVFQRDAAGSPDVIQVRQLGANTLDGYKVRSNSTGILRSEQMYRAAGSIRIIGGEERGWRVVNGSGIDLRDAGVVRRDARGRLAGAWIGALAGDETTLLKFETQAGNRVRLAQWTASPTAYSVHEQVRNLLLKRDENQDRLLNRGELKEEAYYLEQFDRLDKFRGTAREQGADGLLNSSELIQGCRMQREGELRLGRFFDLATEQLCLGEGEVRLLAWTNQPLAGLEIRPRSSQSSFRTFVLVHLRGPRPLPAQPDKNHILDIADDNFADPRPLIPE